jgi:hypothetical protein
MAFSSRGRVEKVELFVSVQLAPPIAKAGRQVQVVPHAIQDNPRKFTCGKVSLGAASALDMYRFCD